jgi:predicted amino acid dehydrogenase
LEVRAAANPQEAVRGCQIVVGAGPTGGTLPARDLEVGTVVVDVAIPGTVVGKPHPSVRILAGEAVSFPSNWNRSFWGHLYHLLSGYGPTQVFACLLEPLVLATMDRSTPLSIGRTIDVSDVAAFGSAATALGFRPRLSLGWRAFPPERLQISTEK